MTFVLTEGELLISHAEANFHDVKLEDERIKAGGLSAVFTYPAHRGHGAGERVVEAATEYLRASAVPFSLLFCGERVRSLYLRAGWEQLPGMRILVGNAAQPTPLEEKSPQGLVMTLFSKRSAEVREKVASKLIYVGETTW
jgi:predicted acetyltransferase